MGSNFLEDAANFATVFGLPIGLTAAIIALVSYLKSSRSADDSHMHALFRDYLNQRVIRCSMVTKDMSKAQIEKLDREFSVVKYYVLEEMYNWLERQWPRKNSKSKIYSKRYDYLLGWKKTIRYHVRQEGNIKALKENHSCYSRDFLCFASRILGSRELYDLAVGRTPAWEPLNSGPIPEATDCRAEFRAARLSGRDRNSWRNR